MDLCPCARPKLLVQGSHDEFGTVADLERFFAALEGPKELKIIEGVDHFFAGGLEELSQAVSRFIESQSASPDLHIAPSPSAC